MTKYHFSPAYKSPTITAADLQCELAAELGSPHAVRLHDGTSLELVGYGVTLALTTETNGNVVCATAFVSADTNVEDVVAMCKALNDVGWAL